MAQDKNTSTESNDGGRLARAGENATAQGKNQSNSTATVTVGCKLPHGLLLDITQHGEPQARFRVKGSNSAAIIGGFGITPGVPKDLWDRWVAKNAQLEFVRKGLIFAYEKSDATRGQAKDNAELSNGLEPIDPNKKRVNLKTLTTEDEVV